VTGNLQSVAPARIEVPTGRTRIESIDLVRGIIIVIMALDHVHDFFGNFASNPVNLTTTTAALFFTRWVTHICAPTFFLLTGTSAWLTLKRMTKGALSRYLLTRGFWLIFLEVVVMRFALQFNLDYHVTILTVLWGLGWAMIVLAALIWLPMWAIATFGVVLIAGHNMLDGIDPAQFGRWAPLWSILHQPGFIFTSEHHVVRVSYVLIPWIGVTALGYVLGAAYRWNARSRQTLLLWLGLGLIAGFAILRTTNVYGDPTHWSEQKSTLWTLMSFVDVVKYPPSLLFLMMTLGPTLLLLRAFDNGAPAFLRPALTIGKVPLFFFVLHFYLIHLLAVAASYLRYGRIDETFRSPDLAHFPFSAPPGWDVGLPIIYLIWLSIVVALYPLCRWYAGVRQRNSAWWLSYL
jgi:uncharacterized membrane protein